MRQAHLYKHLGRGMNPYIRNAYGDCMADTLIPLCKAIDRISTGLGLNMDITQTKLFTSIVQYIELRHESRAYEIRGPQRKLTAPVGWTARHESIWRQWIFHTFTLDDWNSRIIEPIFGSESFLWEPDGWREELYQFLPFWFMRSMERFEEIDPTPLPDEDELAVIEKTKVDPYIKDYYS
jgi:hypothetical protein